MCHFESFDIIRIGLFSIFVFGCKTTLYTLLLHGLSEHESKGNMYHQLITDFLSLDRN